MPEKVPTETILEALRFANTKLIRDEMLARVTSIETYRNEMLAAAVIELNRMVHAEKLISDTIVEKVEKTTDVMWAVPISTWAMFVYLHTNSWWLGWYARRRPAKCKTHTVTVTLKGTLVAVWKGYAMFPDWDYQPPDAQFGAPVFYSSVDHEVNSQIRQGKTRRG